MNPNPSPPKHSGPSGPAQPHTEAAAKPVAASAKPSTGPSKDLRNGTPLAKAGAHATSEPSAKKPTSGPAQAAAASDVKHASAVTDGKLMRTTVENLTGLPPVKAAETSARSHIADSDQLGVMYPRAKTVSQAVTGHVQMTEAMLDAMKGGSAASDESVAIEPFSKARPSIQQVRYPTPYPTAPPSSAMETDELPEAPVRDVDAIEVFKRRRTSISSDSGTASLAQQVADRQTARKNIKAKTQIIDEEHQLSKGERPLKSLIKLGGGPKRKKGVKFCDVDGADLATMRYYFDQEEAPEVPLYATAYLNLDEMDEHEEVEQTDQQQVLRPNFSQPGAAPDFMGRVHMNKVALEFCLVSDTEMNVTGTVRVANISFNKSVTIRYTIDQWKQTDEVKGNYVYYSHDGATDRFSFIIQLPTGFGPGQNLQFAIRFDAGEETYWDNNSGQNYKVECATREMLQQATNSNYLSSIHPNFTWLQYL